MKTQVLPVTPESVALAAKLLQQGELVALPTETVYGIAADARNGAAVAKHGYLVPFKYIRTAEC